MDMKSLATTSRRAAAGACLLGLVALAAGGCMAPLFPELQPRVQKGLSFPAVLQNPGQYTGAVVIWGGVILSTTNRKDGSEVVVLETPLDSEGHPLSARYSRGRFIAKAPGFVDPEVFRRDRRVTFGGEVAGSEARPLGDTQYNYPVLKIIQSHVWAEPVPGYYYPYYPYYGAYWGPYWGPYWDPFWGPWGPYWYGYGFGWHGHGHHH